MTYARRLRASENFDAQNDLIFKIFLPRLVEEHLERYHQVKKWADELGMDQKDLTIVDFASGQGYGCEILKESFSQAQVIGLEIDEKSLRKARKRHSRGQQIQFLKADVTKAPLANESADIVTAFEILEHLPKTKQLTMIKEAKRVLKKSGFIFLSTPYPYSVRKTEQSRAGNPYHLYEPTQKEIENLFAQADLRLVRELGQGFVPQKEVEWVKRNLTRFLPFLWGIYAWGIPRDFSAQPLKADSFVPLTQIFIAQKN